MRLFQAAPLVVLVMSVVSLPLAADELLPALVPIQDVVDHYIDAQLQQAGVSAAPQAAAANVIRRVTLDLAGRIPAAVEVKQYVAAEDADRRLKLVDRLMDSPEFVDQQADRFNTMLMYGVGGDLRPYLKMAFTEKRSWDTMFREMLLPSHDDPQQKGGDQFVKQRIKDIDQLTNDVSVTFFGINITCAKCHDHPEVGDWTQGHYYGMKSFFNRTFENGDFIAERQYGLLKYTSIDGESYDAKLMFLTGAVIAEPESPEPPEKERKKIDAQLKELAEKKRPPPAPAFSRRSQLVKVALKPDQNRFFTRAIVNRVWHQYFGHGLVTPLDQMHSENPPSHPDLLDWLARDLVVHGYDLRRLVRGLVLSQAYSRGSRWESDDRPQAGLLAVANVRPLAPLQLARALSLAAADPAGFEGTLEAEERRNRIAQSADGAAASEFEEPRDNFQVSADEALYFSNSKQVMDRYLTGGLVEHLAQITDCRQIVETAVWSILSRPPSDDELKLMGEYLDRREGRRQQACQQLVWVLLTSTEFRFSY